MSKVNRGKDFEEAVKAAFSKVDNTAVIRLIDPQNGYAGVRNICDFIMYHKPTIFFIECKSCYGNVLPFSNITDNQWKGLLEMSKIDGVVAGYLVWFIDHDITVFVKATEMEYLKSMGKKSYSITKLSENAIVIPGKKKRVMFEYDVKEFMEKWEYLI